MATAIWHHATHDDIDTLSALDKAIFEQPWTRAQHESGLLFPYHSEILYRQQEPVGLLSLLFAVDVCEILLLGVLPQYQAQGLGRQLFSHACELAKDHACTQLSLEVRISNHTAQAFYERCGFKLIRERYHYYSTPDGSRESALVMAFSLV